SLYRDVRPAAQRIAAAMWPVISRAVANRRMTALLLSTDLRCHLVALASRPVMMSRAELSRSVPQRPGPAGRAVFTDRQTAPLIFAAFVWWSLFEKKTEVKSKSTHCQRPG